MARVICTACDNDIKLGLDDEEGSEITCDKCGAKLKLVTDGEYLRSVKEEAA